MNIREFEHKRLVLQKELDTTRTQAERNRLGQFATPSHLALDILTYVKSVLPEDEKVRFLDPAFGTGAFYSALRHVYPNGQVQEAVGFEIDAHYGRPAFDLWGKTGLNLTLLDFTKAKPEPRYNVLICNPPYVRHHHLTIDEKIHLQRRTTEISGIKISGLAGLYCHFLGISHGWMAENGIAGWLIPSEFMDVNYGQEVKRYLLERVTLLHIHRFDPNDVQFADALVSSAIVWFRKAPPPSDHAVRFTFGGSLLEPHKSRLVPTNVLASESKWTHFPTAVGCARQPAPKLADFFTIKRGIATGDNKFFILSETEIQAYGLPREMLRPILPSPRFLSTDIIEADQQGNPLIDRRLFLLDPKLGEDEIANRYPPLAAYLSAGIAKGVRDRYLCRHRPVWYFQENRPPAPIVCTYLGRSDSFRGRPFRFILNLSQATVANVYLAMYPTPTLNHALKRDPALIRQVWQVLNEITPEQLLGEGRVYGGGLYKLEPKELGNVPVPALSDIFQRRKIREAIGTHELIVR